MNDEKYLFHINIDGHEIDYFYDGESMCVFGQEKLDDAKFRLTGMHYKKMRYHSGLDSGI